MRVALLADLHANREAITACLAHADGQAIDRFVVLGDIVGYGADPGWAIDIVRSLVERGALAVLGNHDHAAAGEISEHMNPDAATAIRWTRQQIDAEQVAFLSALPLTVEDEDRLYVHANAWAPARWGYMHGALDARRSMAATHQRLTFCGHVHPPALYNARPDGFASRFVPKGGTTIPLGAQRRWLAVVGSVGQPRDDNPAASYVILDTTRQTLTYHRIPYDHETAAAKIRRAGLPDNLARRLYLGA